MAPSEADTAKKMEKLNEALEAAMGAMNKPGKGTTYSYSVPFASQSFAATGPTGTTGSLADRVRQELMDQEALEMLQKNMKAKSMETEANTLEAQIRLEELRKRKETGAGLGAQTPVQQAVDSFVSETLKEKMGGGADPVLRTVQTMQAMKQLDGGTNVNEIMLRMMEMDSKRKDSENAARAAMDAKLAELQTTMMKTVVDSNRAVYESELKSIKEQLAQGGMGGLIKSFGDIKELATLFQQKESMPPEAVAAMKQSDNMMQLELQKAQLDHRRWEEERKASAEFQKGLMGLGQSLAGPVLTLFAESQARKAIAAQQAQVQQVQAQTPGQPQALQSGAAPPPPPPLASPYTPPDDAAKTPKTLYPPQAAAISGPDPLANMPIAYYDPAKTAGLVEWDMECGNCKQPFHCMAGAEANICRNCWTIHKPQPPKGEQ